MEIRKLIVNYLKGIINEKMGKLLYPIGCL